jgi:iron(II)-dependent oxidoreductase
MARLQELLRWGEPFSTWGRWTVGGVALAVFAAGLWSHNASYLGCGAVVLVTLIWLNWPVAESNQKQSPRPNSAGRRPRAVENEEAEKAPLQLPPRLAEQAGLGTARRSAGTLVDEMLTSGRYALLLRPEMNRHLDREHIVRAVRQLDEAMALVPAGRVLLGPLAEQATSSSGAFDANPKLLEKFMQRIDSLYLDRYVVTNLEYQQFVDAGGYEKLEYWDEEALPALLDFVDQSGQPGPRYWIEGRCHSGDERRPVVGVSWYEASAYARWVGKRLPSDAEWTKAGSWPVESAPGRIAQRRYPWGESFDIRRANLWGSHSKGLVNVDEFTDGESVGGIHQLVGNVWEWSASPLYASAEPTLHVPETFKSVRGGAFDTYFENHATCHYQSGEHPLARRHNIGFRLALPMSTLEVAEEDDAQGRGTGIEADESTSQVDEAALAAT